MKKDEYKLELKYKQKMYNEILKLTVFESVTSKIMRSNNFTT